MPAALFFRLGDSLKTRLGSLKKSRPLKVVGDSMAPALLNRQYVQILPMEPTICSSDRARGKIVAFCHPFRPQNIYLKRIVGLPGEHVAVREGKIEIDGQEICEPYLPARTETMAAGATQWFNGPEEIFLLGDNRADSEDSRAFGPVPTELTIGHVWFRYWPPKVW